MSDHVDACGADRAERLAEGAAGRVVERVAQPQPLPGELHRARLAELGDQTVHREMPGRVEGGDLLGARAVAPWRWVQPGGPAQGRFAVRVGSAPRLHADVLGDALDQP